MKAKHYTVIDLQPDERGEFLVASAGCLERMSLDTIKRLVAEGCDFDSRTQIEPRPFTRNPNRRGAVKR